MPDQQSGRGGRKGLCHLAQAVGWALSPFPSSLLVTLPSRYEEYRSGSHLGSLGIQRGNHNRAVFQGPRDPARRSADETLQ